MRIRKKPWARKELEESKFYEDFPEEWKNKWKNKFINPNNELHLELGCGKGNFISKIGIENPNVNYIAIDLIDAMLGLAKRNVENEYKIHNRNIENVFLTRYDIERISNILGKDDEIAKIYINFCNPWPKAKHNKKRLTHTKQLEQYKDFLKDGGEIHFKTDDDELFNASLKYFEECNFKIIKKTYDLKSADSIETEHEKMFKERGIKIKALIAVKNKEE